MRRIAVIAFLVLLGAAAAVPMFLPSLIWSAPAVPSSMPEPDAKRGAYIFNAGGCASCHTTKGGAALAGGVELKTAFGTFVGPNITPDRATGIGGWSERDFLRAMRVGVAPDGRHYYPAFPYTSYTNLTVRDLRDMWAYLRTVQPAKVASKGHSLGFPWRFRPGIGLWKAIWFAPGPYENDPRKSAAWNRGAYLVTGAAHCVECHTPRNFTGALNAGSWLAGTPKGPDGKPAPNITPHRDGIGTWSEQDMVFFLKSGMLPSGDAVGGVMGKVIEHTSKLDDGDLAAIAEYLRALPALPARRGAASTRR